MTTTVSACTASDCSFNNGGCTALAITIIDTKAPTCGTFVNLDARGKAGDADSKVAVCHRLDCVHNSELTCSNETVEITGADAQCANYESA
ncbi:DUF1540 domain-containing protein [Corynebacterium sp. H113]|uniref:DUF1540 domain-containing protein n=1 Tax=Corynebacterium sp. H113 TaxID=3133419 RepID=UPI0030ACB626